MILALASVHQKNSQIFEIFGSRFVNLSKRLPREPSAKSHHAGDALTFGPLDVCSNDISSTAGLQEKNGVFVEQQSVVRRIGGRELVNRELAVETPSHGAQRLLALHM